MNARSPLDGTAYGLMALVCVIWSLQQVALKAAAADMAPVLQIGLRSGLAAALLAGLLIARGARPALEAGALMPGLAAGVLFALEFLFVGEGLRYTNASRMVVFLYTAPAFAALGLHLLLPEERLRPAQWLGMALAFGGIAVAFSGRDSGQSLTASVLFGDFLGLLGGAAWGATTVVVRCTRLSHIPATHTALYQLAGAFVVLPVSAALLGRMDFRLTPVVWGSLAFQTLLVSFAALLIWFWLLRRYLASRLGVLSFLTPLFGVVFGALLLDEHVEPQFLFGTALVLAGIVLVGGDVRLRERFRREPRS